MQNLNAFFIFCCVFSAVQNERQPRNTATIRPPMGIDFNPEQMYRDYAGAVTAAVGVFPQMRGSQHPAHFQPFFNSSAAYIAAAAAAASQQAALAAAASSASANSISRGISTVITSAQTTNQDTIKTSNGGNSLAEATSTTPANGRLNNDDDCKSRIKLE